MRAAIWVLTLAAIAAAELANVPRVEEDLEQQYNDHKGVDHDRKRRQTYVEGPFEEHIRVKRGWKDESKDRVRRSSENIRNQHKVHQYEVHEHNDEAALPSPPYDQMLAASAEHFQKIYVAPPKPRSLNPGVIASPLTFGVQPAASETVRVAVPASFSVSNVAPLSQPVSLASTQNTAKLSNVDDMAVAAGHHHEKGHNPYSHGFSKSGGHQHHGDHYGEHGGKSTSGGNSNHYVDRGQKGFKIDELHRKEYEDAEGLRKKHHDEASHRGDHEEEAFGSRGSHFGEKKGHKKGHKSKGFHNKYHKDEFQNEHKFYDDFHKDGEHHRYGKFNAKHATNESGKKKVHHVKGGHDFTEHGKKGYSKKGHIDTDNKGHKASKGHEEHHHHHSEHGKKGGKDVASEWGYAKKN